MLTKNQIKYINSLQQSKFRESNKQFIAEGPKLIAELLKSDLEMLQLYVTPQWLSENNIFQANQKAEVVEITDIELEKISLLATPNQALALVKIPEYVFNKEILQNEFVLMLDEIKDPGNLGTIIRTADWFGIHTIICSSECVDVYNPKVIQATMGSIGRVKVIYTDLIELLRSLPSDVPVYGTHLDGVDITKEKLEKRGVVVVGNESRGISNAMLPFIKKKLFIPSAQVSKKAESLNASIATAIVCYEFRR